MPHKTLSASISLLALSQCAGIPKAPQDAGICHLDVPAGEAICGIYESNVPVKREPIAGLDHATAFKPSEWEKMTVYIHELEDYAKSCQAAAQNAQAQ